MGIHHQILLFLIFLMLLESTTSYEKIRIFSDNISVIDIFKDNVTDSLSIESTSGYGISYNGYSSYNGEMPEGLQKFEFFYNNPEYNEGRNVFETPFKGMEIRMTFSEQQSLVGLCNLFSKLLPCMNVKQCNTNLDKSVFDIDIDDVIWTPVSLVPYSVTKTTHIVGKNWLRVARIIVPYEMLRFEYYHSGGCISSIYNSSDLFTVESSNWYPHTTDAKTRFIHIEVNNHNPSDFYIYDSYYVSGYLSVPNITYIDRPGSSVDLILYDYTKNNLFERFTATGHKILYPERDTPFWDGDMKLVLNTGNQLNISGTISSRDGTYNPYYKIYDSRTATVLFLPKGIYVDLAEMDLMVASKKIPEYISYVSNIDTDIPENSAHPQIIVFIAEAQLYPLPAQLDINIEIPIHIRSHLIDTDNGILSHNVTIPSPVFFLCSPVRDSVMINTNPIWWQPAYPQCHSVNITILHVDGSNIIKQNILCYVLTIMCILILLGELVRKCLGQI